MDNIFVYGMLLFEDEEPIHGIDTKRFIVKVQPAWVRGNLYVVEGFPFLVPGGKNKVKGKLLMLKDTEEILERYDVIEGANQTDPFFERVEVQVYLENGSKEKAYCYVGGKNLRECFAKEKYILESGDWLDANP
ncbi:MAG: gamma-glutamylcyclotransferase family protein [Thermoplasmata archaeon]